MKSYLNAESFDDAVAKFKLYKEQVEENNKQKEAKIAEFEDKITAAKDSGEEYEEIVREYQEMQTNWAEVAYPDYVNEVKKYALCVDTLGQDREVPSEDIKKVDLLCQAYVRIWEKTEHKYLMEDVERFIEYEKSVDLEEVIRAFNDAEEKQVTLKLMGAGDLTEEKADYKSDEIRLQVVKEQLLNKDLALKHLLNLNQYQILKFPRVLQNAFYLVGMTKAEVNKPDRNELNWRSVRNSLLTEAFIDRLFQYQYSGQKNDTIPAYAKVNRILKRVSEISSLDSTRHRRSQRLQHRSRQTAEIPAAGHCAAHQEHQHQKERPRGQEAAEDPESGRSEGQRRQTDPRPAGLSVQARARSRVQRRRVHENLAGRQPRNRNSSRCRRGVRPRL